MIHEVICPLRPTLRDRIPLMVRKPQHLLDATHAQGGNPEGQASTLRGERLRGWVVERCEAVRERFERRRGSAQDVPWWRARWVLPSGLGLLLVLGLVLGLLSHRSSKRWLFTVQTRSVQRTETASGTVEPAATYQLYFGAALSNTTVPDPDACAWLAGRPDPTQFLGAVTTLPVSPGTHVTAGTVLAQADDTAALGRLNAAQAALSQAGALLGADQSAAPGGTSSIPSPRPSRTPSVSATAPAASATPGSAASAQFSADAQLGSDEDRVARAGQQRDTALQAVRSAAITAPVNGTVEAVTTAVGSTVSCHSPVMTFHSDSLDVDTDTPDGVLGYLSAGQTLSVTVSAAQQTVQATLTALPVRAVNTPVPSPVHGYPFPFPTPSSEPVYPVHLTLNEPSPRILPGMDATVTFVAVQKGLAVPSSAIHRNEDGTATVLRCGAQTDACRHGGQVETRVTTGLTGDSYSEITSGLAQGDTVVLPGPPPAAPAPAPTASGSASASPSPSSSPRQTAAPTAGQQSPAATPSPSF